MKVYVGVRAYKSAPKEDYRNMSEMLSNAFRDSKMPKRKVNYTEENITSTTATAFTTTTGPVLKSPENTQKDVDGISIKSINKHFNSKIL